MRTTINLDDNIHEQAKEEGINISQVCNKALRHKLDKSQCYIWNTNKQHFPEGEDGTEALYQGVAAAYGDYDQWGSQLEEPSIGDQLIAYVNRKGYCATGRVVGPFNGQEIQNEDEKIDPRVPEWHLPVRWEAVLDLEDAVSRQHGNGILDYKEKYSPSETVRRIIDTERAQLLVDLIRGRA